MGIEPEGTDSYFFGGEGDEAMFETIVLGVVDGLLVGMLIAGMVAYLAGRSDRDSAIKTGANSKFLVFVYMDWCYWKGTGTTKEQHEIEWEEYLRNLGGGQ